jgi:hypothetical protein
MPVDPDDLEQFAEAKVVVKYVPTGKTDLLEVEGTADAANTTGIVFKPKGRQNVILIEASQIEEIGFAPERAKEIKPQDMAILKYGSARKHLADRHGASIKALNALSEEDALSLHGDGSHDDLSHKHVEKKDEEKKEAPVSEETAAV